MNFIRQIKIVLLSIALLVLVGCAKPIDLEVVVTPAQVELGEEVSITVKEPTNVNPDIFSDIFVAILWGDVREGTSHQENFSVNFGEELIFIPEEAGLHKVLANAIDQNNPAIMGIGVASFTVKE